MGPMYELGAHWFINVIFNEQAQNIFADCDFLFALYWNDLT